MDTQQSRRFDFPDSDVRDRVCKFLSSRHFSAFRNLEVDVENGVVLISGQVETYHEKQVALTACQRVAGVLALNDKIVVRKRDRNPIS